MHLGALHRERSFMFACRHTPHSNGFTAFFKRRISSQNGRNSGFLENRLVPKGFIGIFGNFFRDTFPEQFMCLLCA